MSFLNQLKSQAQALQKQRSAADLNAEELANQTETAFAKILPYLQDLARQLSVIQPPGPALSLDGRTPWASSASVAAMCTCPRTITDLANGQRFRPTTARSSQRRVSATAVSHRSMAVRRSCWAARRCAWPVRRAVPA